MKPEDLCPHCAAGNKPRRRGDTGEWCHDYVARDANRDIPDGKGGVIRLMVGGFAHTLCQASDLLNGQQ